MARLVYLLAVLVPLLAGEPARAGDPAVEQAKAHFAEAEKHFKLGRFDEALASYTKAYEAKPLPAFLFNIGQCHRKLKQFDKALFFYQAYLRDMPKAPNRKVVEELIVRCEQQQKKQEARRAEAARALQEAEQARLAAEAEKARLEAEKARLEANRKTSLFSQLPPPSKPPEEPPAYKQAWFWAVIGSVAAAAIAGGVAAGVAVDRGGTRTVAPSGTLGTLDFRNTQ